MPPQEGRTRVLCFWLITCISFVLVTSGGIFLVIYITQPETNEIGWIYVTGMVFISILWIFWILVCLYRSVFPRYRQPPSDVVDSQLRSLGAERRVRFGAATVIEMQDDRGSGNRAAARNDDGSSVGSMRVRRPLLSPYN